MTTTLTGGPNFARVHNVLLGGKDGYNPDRLFAAELPEQFGIAVRQSRAFAHRAIEHLVCHHSLAQIVELGCGFPLASDVGTIAIRSNRTARTLYIDNDPVVAVFGRALLVGDNIDFAEADLADTDTIVNHITAVMDMSTPIALCLSGTAELLPDAPEVLGRLTNKLPPESWLVLSHLTTDTSGHQIDRAVESLRLAGIGYYPRSHGEITTMLADYSLLDPGLVDARRWRPEIGSPDPTACALASVPENFSAYASVGRRSDSR
ncbi:SAM-dependent methyltransferase [Nocardia neocaledoniensis]|uniref:SAM-dependent methyltransferase n=1 Tax=Nocardia neocaledoniensis TaxID=236511 RepID=UPI0024537D19|nr:SAM-dependent methyltransferase [Nocardia neocaledoniensis]